MEGREKRYWIQCYSCILKAKTEHFWELDLTCLPSTWEVLLESHCKVLLSGTCSLAVKSFVEKVQINEASFRLV